MTQLRERPNEGCGLRGVGHTGCLYPDCAFHQCGRGSGTHDAQCLRLFFFLTYKMIIIGRVESLSVEECVDQRVSWCGKGCLTGSMWQEPRQRPHPLKRFRHSFLLYNLSHPHLQLLSVCNYQVPCSCLSTRGHHGKRVKLQPPGAQPLL